MGGRNRGVGYVASTALYGVLALLFLGVLITSLFKNTIFMSTRSGLDWHYTGNYLGLAAGALSYILITVVLRKLRGGQNLDWFMKFTHELTHTLAVVALFGKISEFVVRGYECYVRYRVNRWGIGELSISLAPYCIPIYTFMLFPFRLAGDADYMILFDALIGLSYAFHVHTFIKQTHTYQSDITSSGIARSVVYISFVHFAVLALILAIPKGGVLKAVGRVFYYYPIDIITDPIGWAQEILQYF